MFYTVAGTLIMFLEAGNGRTIPPLRCHHLNDFNVEISGDDSHLNFSLISEAKSKDSVHKSQLSKIRESLGGESNRRQSAY